MQSNNWLTGDPNDMDSTLYERKGYQSRNDYLVGLANHYGVNPAEVIRLANMLGEDDDFDGLVLTIEEYQGVMRMRYKQFLREQKELAASQNNQSEDLDDSSPFAKDE